MSSRTDQDGSTAVEYGIIAGVVGIAFVVGGPLLMSGFRALLDVVLTSMGLS